MKRLMRHTVLTITPMNRVISFLNETIGVLAVEETTGVFQKLLISLNTTVTVWRFSDQ
jgi:hypothetical protein